MKFPFASVRRLLAIGIVFAGLTVGADRGSGQDLESGVRLQPGFTITQVADHALADNVYSLATDIKGNVFVSGPGYIKRLVDVDGDGRFDSAALFAKLPRTGAQGMLIRDGELWCTGDAGLLRFLDADQDGVSDGLPECVMPFQTGGEHTAHALRIGPDGSLFLLAGNQTPIRDTYHDDADTPIRAPRAGFLMKFSPDFQRRQIMAHGFRNAYDFDFNRDGQVFVYDSDGERDIALPWYRPTRLFQIRPGDDAGWVGVGWKRPDYYWDMPITVASLGRGSPTGVAVCPENAFGPEWSDAVLVADWTFGRIMACRRNASGDYLPAEEFAIATGQFGFAITDLDFDRDGSLLVCVGGRGTQGAVFRITSSANSVATAGPSPTPCWRLRQQPLELNRCLQALEGTEVRLQETALELMVGVSAFKDQLTNEPELAQRLVRALLPRLQADDPHAVGLAIRVAGLLPPATLEFDAERDSDPDTRLLVRSLDVSDLTDRKSLLLDIIDRMPDSPRPAILCRLAQLVIGGETLVPSDPMFAGYEASLELELDAEQRSRIADGLARCLADVGSQRESAEPSANSDLETQAAEIGRLAAMCGVNSPGLLLEMMDALEGAKNGSQDVPMLIHWLACCACTAARDGPLDPDVATAIADGLVGINPLIRQQGFDTDRNFYPRLGALADRLFRSDSQIAGRVARSLPGLAEDEYLYRTLPANLKAVAAAAFSEQLKRHPETATIAQLRVLSAEPDSRYLPQIRSFGGRPELRAIVIEAVFETPDFQDQDLLLAGLSSRQPDTARRSAIGWRRRVSRSLDQIEPDQVMQVLIAASLAGQRLGWDRPSVAARDELIQLMTELTGRPTDYQFKQFDLRNADLFQSQNAAVQQLNHWTSQQYPEAYLASAGAGDAAKLLERIPRIDWSTGEPKRGEVVYEKLRCAQCHDGGARLGPRLEGINKRFSTGDLFRSIVQPNAQVPDRYRATTIETADGRVIQGSMVYDSVAGVVLQQADGKTVLVKQGDIEFREDGGISLMPEGLLDEASDQDWADLNAFLILK